MRKKIKNINYYLILIMPLVLTISCSKLNTIPQSTITNANYGTSAVQIEAEYTGSMNFLWGKYYGYGIAGDRTPDVVFKNDDQIQGGNLIIPSNANDPLWQAHYSALANINNALASIKKGMVQETPQTIAVLKAEGTFLRAFNYFNLVRQFGDVPLLTEDSDPTALVARTPVKSVYALIVSDLQYAAANLPSKWANAPGKQTSGTANALLAKVYLTMATYPLNDPSNYAKAAATALLVMNSGLYSLTDSCSNVFLPANTYSPEMIWAFNSVYSDKSSWAGGWSPGDNVWNGWDNVLVDTAFEHRWPAQPRKDAYLLLNEYGVPGVVSYATDFPTSSPYCKKFFFYLNSNDYNNYNCANNMPILRYADVLLIYAEAANQAAGSPTQAACDAANLVINRANGYIPNAGHPLLTPAMSLQAFDDAIIQERSWELCFEWPDRWYDIIRKRILDKVSAPYPQYLTHFTPNAYLFPIPKNDLQLDKLLIQNPGYPNP